MTRSYASGYESGWRSIMGEDAPAPTVPQISLPREVDPYNYGVAKGTGAAKQRKAEILAEVPLRRGFCFPARCCSCATKQDYVAATVGA
jgi:hypothetical protein